MFHILYLSIPLRILGQSKKILVLVSKRKIRFFPKKIRVLIEDFHLHSNIIVI